MFAPVSAIRPAIAATAAGLSGMPEHGDVAAALGAAAVVAGAAVDLDLHAEVVGDPLQRASRSAFQSRGTVTSSAEHQPAAQHDLLDVEDLDAERGQGGEDRRGDARPVLAGQRDEQGLRASSSMSRPRLTVPGERAGGHQTASRSVVERRQGLPPGVRLGGGDAAAVVLEREVDDRAAAGGQRGQAYGARAPCRAGTRSPRACRRAISSSATSGRQRATSRSASTSVVRTQGLAQRLVGLRRVGHLAARHGVVAAPHDAGAGPVRHQARGPRRRARRPRRPRRPRG